MNAVATQDSARGFGLLEGIENTAVDNADRWLAGCDKLRVWYREKFLVGDPSAEDRKTLEQGLPWMIRGTRALHSLMLDPNWPHRELARRLDAALWQLDQIWESEHNPMSDADADKLLAEIFPDAPRS